MPAPKIPPASATATGAAGVCAPDAAPAPPPVGAPVIAYVLLWFPLSSETFIFREVVELGELGLDIRVYTMYGAALKGCSREMREYPGPVTRMGVAAFFRIFGAFFRALGKSPRLVWRLLREGFFRRMRNVEALGENLWCFMAGFLLAEDCARDGVTLIHSSWANGPATAAWVASRLTGIPFAFTGRAGDIYPEDGLLREKSRDALFVRTNNAANVAWLARFCPPDAEGKVRLVYNSLTFTEREPGALPMQPPYRLLAVGRFARTKGFPELITALARLRRERVPMRLTLVGDGAWRGRLVRQIRRLGLESCVDLPGFVPHDELRRYMQTHDMLVVPSVVHSNGDRDGIPNVIMEALSMGLPVVATDVCGIAEVIRDGETGLLVPERDPAALACAVRRLLADRDRARAMALAGRDLVEAMFDRARNIAALRNLYAEASAPATEGAP
ncbi:MULTISPECIES: glycosyltransferase family 4 protein [unclassified Desulfovibrio]|uniref:glycosyltransferase family 4 protein n=1 Tax=unclassified Desulfovibrio TaxID=2593640 RepID=UPI0013EA3590|nr:MULTISPECIES: glycosyltransferase family 4 protein [unclassified Desulfovibrio]